MFEPLLKAARDSSNSSSPPDVSESVLQAVPEGLSYDDIKKLVRETQDGFDTTVVLLAVYAVLKSGKLKHQSSNDADSKAILEDVAIRIGEMIEPVCSGATYDEDSTDYAGLLRNGLLGLHIIKLLLTLSSQGDQSLLPTKTLLSVAAFANGEDPWSSKPCAALARSLLSDYFQTLPPPTPALPVTQQSPFSPYRSAHAGGVEGSPARKAFTSEKARFVTEDVLTGFLRPLFAKSRPATVTASGRAAAFPEPAPRYGQGDGFGDDDATVTKPWKYARRYAVTIFAWAVKNSDTDTLQQHWPLYTPILLTLLDEPQPTSLKLQSLSIFRDFWRLCPEGLLSRTGLADVFEHAAFPTALSLPSITPEAESIALLGSVYPALFDMAGIEESSGLMAVGNEQGDDNDDDDDNGTDNYVVPNMRNSPKGFSEAQRKLLDKIFREGIMTGYHHAKGHIRLVDLFCKTLRCFIDCIGILSVKYLKDTIPMISEILVDPFGTKYPPALLSAMLLLQAILQTCWPRIPRYCNEIIKTLMLSWLNIENDDALPPHKPSKEELKQELIKTAEMLSAISAAAELDISNRLRPLVMREPQLEPLFISCNAP